jgi:hypothetical protein
MESPNSGERAGLKRKRTPVPGALEEGTSRAAPTIHPGNVTQINYLMRAKAEKLRLIEGDNETFGIVLGMIDDYEGMFTLRDRSVVTGSRDLGGSSSHATSSFQSIAFVRALYCSDFCRCPSTSRKLGCQSRCQACRPSAAKVF